MEEISEVKVLAAADLSASEEEGEREAAVESEGEVEVVSYVIYVLLGWGGDRDVLMAAVWGVMLL